MLRSMRGPYVVVLLAILGCGRLGASGSNPDGGSSSDANGGSNSIADGGIANYAFRTLFLGDTDETLTSSTNAWSTYGINVDGKVTTATSTDVCERAVGTPATEQVDGPNGLDNSFGKNVLPLILQHTSTVPSVAYSQAMAGGMFTTMLDVAFAPPYPVIVPNAGAQVFVGATFQGVPSFTLADNWPVRPEFLADPRSLEAGSSVQLPSGGIDGGVWTSAGRFEPGLSSQMGTFPLPLFLNQTLVTLPIHAYWIEFTETSATTVHGSISGVVSLADLTVALDTALFPPTTPCSEGVQTFNAQIAKAADILDDGTNTQGPACSAISIGLGFVAERIGAPSEIGQAVTTPDLICDAGEEWAEGFGLIVLFRPHGSYLVGRLATHRALPACGTRGAA